MKRKLIITGAMLISFGAGMAVVKIVSDRSAYTGVTMRPVGEIVVPLSLRSDLRSTLWFVFNGEAEAVVDSKGGRSSDADASGPQPGDVVDFKVTYFLLTEKFRDGRERFNLEIKGLPRSSSSGSGRQFQTQGDIYEGPVYRQTKDRFPSETEVVLYYAGSKALDATGLVTLDDFKKNGGSWYLVLTAQLDSPKGN